MIVINSIDEIEEYKVEEYIDLNEEDTLIKRYEFKENGEFSDVVFNINLPFSYFEMCERNVDALVLYEFTAKDVCFKCGGGLHILWAENVTDESKFGLEIDELFAEQNIRAKRIHSTFVRAKNIECEDIFTCNLNCKHIKADKLSLPNIDFCNINCDDVSTSKI